MLSSCFVQKENSEKDFTYHKTTPRQLGQE
jgi:hypothetical protein